MDVLRVLARGSRGRVIAKFVRRLTPQPPSGGASESVDARASTTVEDPLDGPHRRGHDRHATWHLGQSSALTRDSPQGSPTLAAPTSPNAAARSRPATLRARRDPAARLLADRSTPSRSSQRSRGRPHLRQRHLKHAETGEAQRATPPTRSSTRLADPHLHLPSGARAPWRTGRSELHALTTAHRGRRRAAHLIVRFRARAWPASARRAIHRAIVPSPGAPMG
jgi:hypothetical protein